MFIKLDLESIYLFLNRILLGSYLGKVVKSMAESPGFNLFWVPHTSQEHQNVIFELLNHSGHKCGFEYTWGLSKGSHCRLGIYILKGPKKKKKNWKIP